MGCLKSVTVLKELYRHTSNMIRDYSQFSLPFVVSSGLRQGYPVSPFTFNFVAVDVLRNTLSSLVDDEVELSFDLECADGQRCTGNSTRVGQLGDLSP